MTSSHPLTDGQMAFVRNHLPGFSIDSWDVSLAGQAASTRVFVRLEERSPGTRAFILVVWDARDEDWRRFMAISDELSTLTTVLPAIHSVDSRLGCILEEDLGSMTLKRFISDNRHDPIMVTTAYRSVIDALCRWQKLEPSSSPTIAARVMNEETFLWESDYFARRYVTDCCGCEDVLDEKWELERRILASSAAALPRTFIHRDFQSENILLDDGQVRLVDFQGARLGPPEYDVASLVFDPYIEMLDHRFAHDLLEYYRTVSPHCCDLQAVDLCATQRLMQALGAYGSLSTRKGKPRYREFIPAAQRRLGRIAARLDYFPALQRIVDACSSAGGV